MRFFGYAGPHRGRTLLAPTVLLASVAVALDLVHWLGSTPLWVDEEMIALNIRDRSVAELPGRLWLGQGAPFGWLLVQRIILLTLGSSELSLRLVPLVFGIAMLAVAVWIGHRWLHRPAAVLFVLLCALAEWLSHYRFELKHYSADALFALLLPAMAAWAAEERDGDRAPVRWTRWWIVAAFGQWFAFGALLVTPPCAVLLAIVIRIRHGWRAALRFAAMGIVWAASFAVHYFLSLQYTSNSTYLRTYWADHLAPTALGAIGRTGWVVEHLDELALDPGGTTLAAGLWGCALFGFIVGRRSLLAAMFAVVPLVAFLLGALRLVPLGGRLALWIVPALYLGISLLFENSLRHGLAAWRRRRWAWLAAYGFAATAAACVSGNILVRGVERLDRSRSHDSNRGVDDRRAVAWLMARHRPGDVIMSTRLGWPAIWWYGDVPIRRPFPRGFMRDGSVMYEVSHERTRPGCGHEIQAAVEQHRRVLVYVGFPDQTDRFFDRLLSELSSVGAVVDQAQFADRSRTAVIDLYPPHARAPANPPIEAAEGGPLGGCVEVHTARRW